MSSLEQDLYCPQCLELQKKGAVFNTKEVNCFFQVPNNRGADTYIQGVDQCSMSKNWWLCVQGLGQFIAFTFVMKYGFEKINEKECGKSGLWL